MYEVNTATNTPENIIAGDYPITKGVYPIKSGVTVTKHTPVKLVGGEIEPVVKIEATEVDATNAIPAKTIEENTVENLYGIAAEDGSGGEAVIYLTGEFFADKIPLPADVTIDMLKPAFRKLGIFLK
ncbi:hypothetical protein [Tepidibacter thalassicus]|uniref:Bacteriophage lambda head decoration protein D n=1 Tax=Tepidibacter thalassicus DSM 15285 TaxID=1123350 RepID=A0A1M5NL02_9FIRM|nr:hypothetical protein [Tepidibacter thalassicus]SHG90230.1 hypothetical protein SAMN02744040_00100 [Tepidibacter thalassicus DSM 15285]